MDVWQIECIYNKVSIPSYLFSQLNGGIFFFNNEIHKVFDMEVGNQCIHFPKEHLQS